MTKSNVHMYIVPISPKMLKETLCVVQSAMHALEREHPGYNAGGTTESHLARIQLLINECDRMRPIGRDGNHGNLHTRNCGCSI